MNASMLASSDAQHRTLDDMQLLGITVNGADYQRDSRTNQLAQTALPPWRCTSNGNPPDMLSVARELFESETILFIVERDTNRNVVMYTLSEGDIVPRWLMTPAPPVHYDSNTPLPADAEIDLGDVHTESLTALEAAFGYGVRVERGSSSADKTGLLVQALSGQRITLDSRDGEAVATIQMVRDTEPLILRRIMIHTEPRPLAPWPKVVEIHLEVQQSVDGPSIWYRYAC
jgi:hypothetical protein